jgi:NAD+ synthase
MKLSGKVFQIDSRRVSGIIEDFIRKELEAMNRGGIVVPISGGLDSSVVAALCAHAVGKDRVVGLMLPEKEGNPEAKLFSEILIEYLDIERKEIDISRELEIFGTYEFALSRIPTRFLKKYAVKGVLNFSKTNPFWRGMRGEGGEFVRKGIAHFYIKNRVRFVVACKFAEENGLMLVGSAHKSEDMVGLFVKYGVDDLADVMPLKNLYRSHILQLAEYLGIPREIIERPPNPDIIPGVEDKYKDMLGLESETLDLILYGFENNMSCSEIAMELNLKEKKVEEIKKLIEATRHMRHHSRGPDF